MEKISESETKKREEEARSKKKKRDFMGVSDPHTCFGVKLVLSHVAEVSRRQCY